jgi:hypothetical protein
VRLQSIYYGAFFDENQSLVDYVNAYLDKHQTRIVNYSYYQAEQLCSIGSGAGVRIKISGAQWKIDSVKHILSVRCAYLNGLFAI